MTEEEKLKALWEIAQEVAKGDSTYSDDMGDVECVYCNGSYSHKDDIYRHEPNCIVTKARALLLHSPLVEKKDNT